MSFGAILRVALLSAVPILWFVLVISSASESERSHWPSWLGLPIAIVLVYAPLAAALVSARRPWPAFLAISAIFAIVALITHVRNGFGSDATSAIVVYSEYAVWVVAVAGLALGVWHRSETSWPRDGYIAAAVVQLLMISPPLVIFAIFAFSMAFGG